MAEVIPEIILKKRGSRTSIMAPQAGQDHPLTVSRGRSVSYFSLITGYRSFNPRPCCRPAPRPREIPGRMRRTFLWHFTLPLFTLAFASFKAWACLTRNLVLPMVHEDFVQGTRARGAPEGRIMRKHVLWAASPAIVTTLGISLIASLNGIILVEGLFGSPGVGWLYSQALSFGNLERYGPVDTPILIALPVLYAMLFLGIIFVLDFTYGRLDPRIRALEPRKAAR